MEKKVSSEPTTQTKMTKAKTKFHRDESKRNQWLMTRIFRIETAEKNVVRTASLRVVDRNILSPTQVLRRPIAKTERLVGNNYFGFPIEEP